jgi:hypothetical protein
MSGLITFCDCHAKRVFINTNRTGLNHDLPKQ